MQYGLVLSLIGMFALGSLLLLSVAVLLLRDSDPESSDSGPDWSRLKDALNLREENPLALAGRWDSYSLLVQYLPKKGQTNPKLLFILETNLNNLPGADVRRAGGEMKVEAKTEKEGLEHILDRNGIRRPLCYLVEEKGRGVLLREDGLALERPVDPDFFREPPLNNIRDELGMLSLLAQELQSVNAALSSKPPSYPFQS